ncbi:MAG TPA: helix-turn-helix transcriptional regulator [Pyrinomonadaceae bacterium]
MLQIREALGLSQNGMLRVLGFADAIDRSAISDYENDVREPPLPVLLEYARAANVYIDALVDDEADLPKKLPTRVKGGGVKKQAR